MIQSEVVYRDLLRLIPKIRGSTGLKRKKKIEDFEVIVRTAIKDNVDISKCIPLIDIGNNN